MRIRASLLLYSLAYVSPVFAQAPELLVLDNKSAQERLLQRSDGIEPAVANLRGKETQEGATHTLGRPEVDVEAQLLQYLKTRYLPLGSLAPVAQSFDIRDPLKFLQERTCNRPIVTATLPPTDTWRDHYGQELESRRARKRTVGSNPTLSAISLKEVQ